MVETSVGLVLELGVLVLEHKLGSSQARRVGEGDGAVFEVGVGTPFGLGVGTSVRFGPGIRLQLDLDLSLGLATWSWNISWA